jgi:menaquinone-dependent protoporphyrinogen oxidase
MRVLVTWGSKLGGTEGIARIIAESLQRAGFDVTAAAASEVRDAAEYDAAIIGGALYANRWHVDARRFVARNLTALRRIPVWLFSSGPLDDSAERQEIPPVGQVSVLMDRTGARGHVTFGGRLAADARGFPAAAMARTSSGDWRNPERIRAWAAELARALPGARPGRAIDLPARSRWRLLAHGGAGWALCAVVLAGLSQVVASGLAIALHAVAAPLVFTGIAVHYFGARGARDPLPTALAFAGIVAVLDAGVIAGLIFRSPAMFRSFSATWLPPLLIFLATWLTGLVMSTMPWPRDPDTPGARHQRGAGDHRDAHVAPGA